MKLRWRNLSVFGKTLVVFLVTVVIALLLSWLILFLTSGQATYLLFMVMGWFAGGAIVGTYTYLKGRASK